MSYKSLLFCPDEKAAHVVSQVLSELEFTVELSNEPSAAVKSLTDEHFDAVVVDCQNEQDASLLFQAARSSSLNHSSLSVAVVEGQAGVAKAFRIGANLVLTKPVNVEQSKSTLRVARGLLRKNNEAKAAFATAAGAPAPKTEALSGLRAEKSLGRDPVVSSSISPVGAAALHPAIPSTPAGVPPFAALEVEQEPTPAPEPSEVALLESMRVDGKPAPAAESMWAPKSTAEPIAASTGGHAAAAAPALAKATEVTLSGAAPMITNEPIVSDNRLPDPMTEISVPTFSALEGAHSSSGGGKTFLKTAVMLLILGGAGYLAWQRFQPLQYLHGFPAQTVKQPATSAEPAPVTPVAAPAAQPAQDNEPSAAGTTPSSPTPDLSSGSGAAAANPSDRNFTAETIRVQELPLNSDPKPAAPKSQPVAIQVKPGLGMPKPAQPAPPSLPLTSSASNSVAALNSIVPVNVPAPRPAPGSLRISQGVSQGLVVKKVAPVYSQTALQLHKQGAVELMATVSKEGSVSSVRVLSGDVMLANSAVEAVKQWKYRPYLLNGEPVEIETQITVNFRLPR